MSTRVPLLLLLLMGCDAASAGLVVQLKTDYVPGREFIGVRTEYAVAPFDEGPAARTQEAVASGADDFVAGERIADLAGVAPGTGHVRVTLLGPGGDAVHVRRAIVEVAERTAITVLVSRTCEGVVCPGATDPPSATECIGGACADPRCAPESPEDCDLVACGDDGDCPAAGCRVGACVDGACFEVVDDARCGAGEVCDPVDGCTGGIDAGVADAGLVDSGPGCPPTELACDDGADEDCDALTDCEDPDCDGARCDDGVFCNGEDSCGAGACSVHASPPCGALCDEAARACVECLVDADCGAPTEGPWGSCGGFGGTCGEAGTRSRDVMTPTCDAGACAVVITSRSEPCARDTDGTSCGTTSCPGWGSCDYSSACDERATQRRTCTVFACSAGSCASSSSPQSRSCTRDTDGDACVLIPGCPAECVAGGCNPICATGCPC